MSENFFADYKKFIVVPEDENRVGKEVYDPKNYAAYYILTLSIFNSRISTWRDASKFEIDVEKSIKTVILDFNQNQRGIYHLQLLELDRFKNYFILALSSKTKFEEEEAKERISFIIDRILTNPFYVAQNWFNLIGEKGRVERKLFCWSFKEYKVENQEQAKINEKYENISEIVPKSGEIKLIKSSLKRDIL
ncbi:hypothetical protein [Bacillus sp. EB600]|uniref:hypothetical protein n=1 Tax=Bacillus sp. EB600 TaxID=2806345 RepID=UPI00210C96E7|nr:hypothetical protein [Bacillus sp. EB600]MCQ6277698.1 hypothetical protein [Bacillus sp. EB600]